MRTLISGEGVTELGDLAKEAPYRLKGRDGKLRPGMIQLLVEQRIAGKIDFVPWLGHGRLGRRRFSTPPLSERAGSPIGPGQLGPDMAGPWRESRLDGWEVSRVLPVPSPPSTSRLFPWVARGAGGV